MQIGGYPRRRPVMMRLNLGGARCATFRILPWQMMDILIDVRVLDMCADRVTDMLAE